MQNFLFLVQHSLNQEISRLAATLFLATCMAILAGCGSGPDAPKTTDTTTTGSGTTSSSGTTTGATTTATTATSTLTLALTNSAGATVTTVTNGAPATLKATLKNAGGSVVPSAVVTFSTDPTLATIAPTGTAVTDSSGVATVTLSPATTSAAGATTIKASAQVGSDAVSNSIGITVGTTTVAVSTPVLGVGAAALSAFGTTSISVTVTTGGVAVTTPQNVTFSSICASAGKATLSTGVVTGTGGVATGSYKDNGCASTDSITATVAGVTSAATSLVVTPPTTASIQFVSATPSNISLKGIGGTESSQVSFKVVDANGKPLSGKSVTLSLNTSVGGITLVPSVSNVATATSDASGLVTITVNSGTVSTPVRVTASTIDTSVVPNVTLTTQSSGLTISTGIPDQDSFSLGATIFNPEFLNIDGNTTVLTARLADHFNNPVPDGTVVNFTTEGGSITPSCSTTGGACSATLTSQTPRPANGRVTVLAYAVGEESFIDLNGNGVADLASVDKVSGAALGNEMRDVNSASSDLPEAFRDDNENLVHDPGETFIDFNGDGGYNTGDGKYSGVLCSSASSPGTCATNSDGTPKKTLHVFRNIVIAFSGSDAVITKISPAVIDLGSAGGTKCPGTSVQVNLRIVDINGNPMPAGSTITIGTTNGTIAAGAGSITVNNENAAVAAGLANYSVSVKDDSDPLTVISTNPTTGVQTLGCVDKTISGVLTVTVKTPGSGSAASTTTTQQFSVLN